MLHAIGLPSMMAEQYFEEQIVKGSGCLEDIFTDANYHCYFTVYAHPM